MDLKNGNRYRLNSTGKDCYIVEIISISKFIRSIQIIGNIKCAPKEYCAEVFKSIFEPVDPPF